MLNNWAWRTLLPGIGKPYIDLGKNRLFPKWVKWNDLKWHMDDEDRTVKSTHKTDWIVTAMCAYTLTPVLCNIIIPIK